MAKRKRKSSKPKKGQNAKDENSTVMSFEEFQQVNVENLSQVAEFFGVSIATVNGWRRRGMPGVAGIGKKPGRFNLCEVVQWRIKRMEEPSSLSDNSQKIKIAKLTQDVKIAQLKYEKLLSGLVDVEVTTLLLEQIVEDHGKFCDELQEQILELLPSPGDTIGEHDADDIAARVADLVKYLRIAMSDGLKLWADSLEETPETTDRMK